MEKVLTLDDLNVRLAAWLEADYNRRPHAGLSGRTPLEVWEEDAERVRWAEDLAALEVAFTATLERRVRNDATVQIHGRSYEVPQHLRRQHVKVGYSLLRPDVLWIEDGDTRVLIREVEPEANAERSRRPNTSAAPADAPPRTGMNAVEDLLRRVSRPLDGRGAEGVDHVA